MRLFSFIIFLFAFHFYSCTNPADNVVEPARCTCPPTICLQPFGDYTQQEAKQLKKVLEKKFVELYGIEFDFEILPNKKLSTELMNDKKSRYRADKIIYSLSNEAGDHRIIIGLTHKDISVPYKGRPDWGVLGLSIQKTYTCLASTYRLKHKRHDFWKVVTHEFTHTVCAYGHCPEDNPNCIMKDAKGCADFSTKNGFCKTCDENIHI